MNNYGKALEYAGVSANSSGTAMKKFEAYQDSIEAKSKKFTATLEGLSSAFVNSDVVKNVLDIGSGALSGLTKLIDKFGTIPTVVGAATLALGLFNKNIGIFQNQNGQLSIFGKTVEEIKQAKAEGQAFGSIFSKQVVQPFANAESVITKYNLGVEHNSITTKGFNSLLDQSDESLGNYLKNLNGSKASMEGYNKSLKISSASTKGLTLATTLLNAAISMGILIAVNLAVKAIQNYINKIDNLKSKVEESKQAYEDTKTELEDINKQLEDNQALIKEINENPLDYTGDKTLEDLQNQNLELENQKKILEEISKMKLQVLNQDTESLLNTNNSRASETWNLIKNKKFKEAGNLLSSGQEDKNNTYKYSLENMISPVTGAFSFVKDLTTETQSVITETSDSIQKLKNITVRRNEILADGIISKDEENELAKINTEYNSLNKTLVENMQLLQDNKANLDETSGTYKTILDIEKKYIELTNTINNGDISNGITDEFIKSKNKIEGVSSSSFSIGGTYGNKDISKDIIDSFDSDNGYGYVKIEGNAIEQYDKISAIIDKINTKRSSGNKLTKDEQALYDDLIKRQTKLANIISNNRETYISGIVSETNLKFQNYIKANPLNDNTNFKEWEENLYKIANGNELIKSIITYLINQTFPDEVYQIQNMTDAEKAWYYQQKMNVDQSQGVKSIIDEANEALNTYGDTLKNIPNNSQMLADAFSEQEKNGKLSNDTILKLTEAGYAQAVSYNEVTGVSILLKNVTDDLTDAKYSKIKADLTEKKIDLTEKYNEEKKALDELKSSINSASDAELYMTQLKLFNDKGYDEAIAEINSYLNLINNPDNNKPEKEKNTKTEDTWKESFEKQLAQQKHFLAMGKNEITNKTYTEKDYLDWLEKAYKEYFSNLTKYQDEYNQYEEEVLNGRKELREKEIEDQKKAVEDEIKYLNDLKTAYTDKIKDYQEDLLKPINDRIELLKNENSEVEKTNELLEAQKALEDSLQRKNYVYRKGQGFVYEQDQKTIKEAKDNLAKVERNNEIDSLEKQKSNIETNMDNALESIENFFDSATKILQNNIDGETSPKNNPQVWKDLQYTPITLDTIKNFNISDEAKKLFSLDFGKTLNNLSNVNVNNIKKISDLMNGVNIPVANNSVIINKGAFSVTIQGNTDDNTISQIKKIVDDEFNSLADRIQIGSIQNKFK